MNPTNNRRTQAGSPWSRRAVLGTGGATLAAASIGLAGAARATTTTGAAAGGDGPTAQGPYGPVTLHEPPADRPAPGTLYARAVRLEHTQDEPSPLLATFEYYADTMPVFPIFRSDDDGRTWSRLGDVEDTVNGWGLRYQPDLYELPRPFGGLPEGTILCAGNSIPDDLSETKIDLYASMDGGATWEFTSSIARGGRTEPVNGETPVWEPFLLLYEDRLICFYSDQRDPDYGQKLVHQTSTDLQNWGPEIEDAVGTDYEQRPGMTTVASLPDGTWILTYEGGGDSGDNFFAVHYKISDDPEAFADVEPTLLQDPDGNVPAANPTVSWSPHGGPNGTIIVSAGSSEDLLVNRELGAPDAWTYLPTVVPSGYTRFTMPLDNGLVFVVTGGILGNEELNIVQNGVDPLE